MTPVVGTSSRQAESVNWDRLVQSRPLLGNALYLAQHLQRHSRGFCANRVFYSILKPIVCGNVGWDAEPQCPFSEHIRTVGAILDGKPIEHTGACRAAWGRSAWLQTTAAYDLAYRTIYEALPNCQHEGFC